MDTDTPYLIFPYPHVTKYVIEIQDEGPLYLNQPIMTTFFYCLCLVGWFLTPLSYFWIVNNTVTNFSGSRWYRPPFQDDSTSPWSKLTLKVLNFCTTIVSDLLKTHFNPGIILFWLWDSEINLCRLTSCTLEVQRGLGDMTIFTRDKENYFLSTTSNGSLKRFKSGFSSSGRILDRGRK